MANSDLTRTISSAGNLTTWTFSAWVKFSEGSTQNCGIFSQGSSGDNVTSIFFNHSNGAHRLEWRQYQSGSYTARKTTNRSFNDRSGWYHIVCQWDTTNGTAGDRMKIWINGERETSFESSVDPSSSLASVVNSTTGTMNVGKYWDNSNYMNGYMAHVAFVNGAVVAPTVFGETDSTSGIWKFKSPSGVTWGTNGFHLKFENSGAMGTDSSGNSNTFTVNGNLKQALDTPSNVYSTWNPLLPHSSLGYSIAYSYGNNNIQFNESSTWTYVCSTLGATSGKYYFEAKLATVGSEASVGILELTDINSNQGSGSLDDYVGKHTNSVGYFNNGRTVKNNNNEQTGLTALSAGSIVGVAMDLDNNTVQFYVNGSSVGNAESINANKTYFFGASGYNSTKWECNFGNGYFADNAISSAGSNGNGSLFEYDVPSGFYALNTKNINIYG